LEKFGEISAHSEEFMAMAQEEYVKLTNGIPDAVSEAIEQTLVKTISEREDKMRKMFPKLTKEKQAEVVSKLSDLTEEESEKIFVTLFADHLSELGKLQDSMDKIYAKEGGARATSKNTNVETTLALLSSLIDIASREFDTKDHWEGPQKDPKEKNPKPKDKSAPSAKEKKPAPKKKKAEPKKKDTSSDNQ
jgi:hypothetical protein